MANDSYTAKLLRRITRSLSRLDALLLLLLLAEKNITTCEANM